MIENKMLVGIAGPAGSGKDTVGAWFVKNYGFKRYAMASALKAGMAAMGFPEPVDRAMKEQAIPGFSFTWREAAQRLGTEWGRGLDPAIWIKIAQRDIALIGDSVVITDIRFENEAAMLRASGGTLIHILGRKADLGVHQDHVSEKPVLIYPDTDVILDNRGSLEDLYEQLEGFMNV